MGTMKRENITFARSLRQTATGAERTLWKHLRNRGVGGARFRRQHGVSPYILDFYCVEALLAIELDGDVHGMPEQGKHDCRRDEFLTALGIKVLRFWNNDVFQQTSSILEAIMNALL